MTQQTINIGAAAEDHTGDPLRTALDKANQNFNELYKNANALAVGHVAVALLGDSHTRRNFDDSLIFFNLPLCGIFNQTNWAIGAPFVIEQNLGVSGDVIANIMARISYISPSIQAVVLMPGTNDVHNMSSAASQATIDSTFTAASTKVANGIAALLALGKKVQLCTILPHNDYNTPSDSRIQLLDRLNAYYATLAGPSVFVADTFTAAWDNTQPTLRLFKPGYTSDNIHTNNNGGHNVGTNASCLTAARNLYNACVPNRNIYAGFQPQQILYGNFASGTNGTAPVKSNGTGNLADGWRSINNVGTAVFTMDNGTPYVPDTVNMLGPWLARPSVGDFWQRYSVSSAVANDNPRLRYATQPASNMPSQVDGAFGGSEFFMEAEIMVDSAVNLREVQASISGYFNAGAAPADQPYQGSTYMRVSAGNGTAFSLADAPAAAAWRAVYRTPVLRIPENVLLDNVTNFVKTLPMFDPVFAGAGSANIWFALPRVWHRPMSRFG